MAEMRPQSVRQEHRVDQIEEIRAANNHAWMELLRLALRVAPEEARQIIGHIRQNDEQILKLLEELAWH